MQECERSQARVPASERSERQAHTEQQTTTSVARLRAFFEQQIARHRQEQRKAASPGESEDSGCAEGGSSAEDLRKASVDALDDAIRGLLSV